MNMYLPKNAYLVLIKSSRAVSRVSWLKITDIVVKTRYLFVTVSDTRLY
jgi:hypothetical protein